MKKDNIWYQYILLLNLTLLRTKLILIAKSIVVFSWTLPEVPEFQRVKIVYSVPCKLYIVHCTVNLFTFHFTCIIKSYMYSIYCAHSFNGAKISLLFI